MRLLALAAILPAGATFYFFVFWRWFDHWRRHRVQTYTLMLGTFVALVVAVHLGRDVVFAPRAVVPLAVQGIDWVLIAMSVCSASSPIGRSACACAHSPRFSMRRAV